MITGHHPPTQVTASSSRSSVRKRPGQTPIAIADQLIAIDNHHLSDILDPTEIQELLGIATPVIVILRRGDANDPTKEALTNEVFGTGPPGESPAASEMGMGEEEAGDDDIRDFVTHGDE